MTLELPADNPVRMRLGPLIALLSQAARLRAFNHALGVSVLDLTPYPVDFVDVVVQWNGTLNV